MPEISLSYACECRDVWTVVTEPPAGLPTQCEFPCVPETCQTCVERGEPCPTRQSMSGIHAYRPIEWSELNGGSRRVIRMPRTGTKEWEKLA